MMVGYKVISQSRVFPVRTKDEAARQLANSYPEQTTVRLQTSLTTDRPLTTNETLELADMAAKLLVGKK